MVRVLRRMTSRGSVNSSVRGSPIAGTVEADEKWGARATAALLDISSQPKSHKFPLQKPSND